MFKLIRNLNKNQAGATAIEYGLIAALVSVAAIAAMTALGGSLTDMFDSISGTLDSSAPTTTTTTTTP
ncbi:MAG: Flp family type IVb pilin [Sphingomonadales bacterium]|nr:Flp family type IVb pilin [Sphingomonadales bacterium]